jgi:hypothetical protein
VLTGPEGSEAFCNRVAPSVEIGAQDNWVSDDGQGSEQGGEGSGGHSNDESAATTSVPHVTGLTVSAVACGFAACWLQGIP